MLLGCKATSRFSENISQKNKEPKWKLVFEDSFNSRGDFNQKKWTFSPRGNSPWSKYLTPSSKYVYQSGGSLMLMMDNQKIDEDNVPYHSGGIQTKGKFSFLYGKVEVKAKFKSGKGAWPAIWMMPEKSTYGTWPNSGEIDIMEQVNFEKVAHQTIHNASVTNSKGNSSATHAAKYKLNDFNIYGIIWTPKYIQFYVNNILQYTYNKPENADYKTWPFDQPFYLILNQSGGLGWPGAILDADLPFNIQVDWVKVYQENKSRTYF